VLIISISTHLFIHLNYYPKEEEKRKIIQNIYIHYVHCEKYKEKKNFFYIVREENIWPQVPTFFREKKYHIVSLSYYLQLKHWLIWYACISSQNDQKKYFFDLVLHCICMTVVPCTKVLKDSSSVWSYKIFEYYQHLPKMVWNSKTQWILFI
jgi:hypothetical protein